MGTTNNIPTQPIKTPNPVVQKQLDNLGNEKLMEALFFFWDGFERATMNFFLVKDTAKQIIDNQPLSGDKITLGIRRMEWNGGQERVFGGFIEYENIVQEKISDNHIVFTYKNVPVHLYIYEDNPSIDALDIVFYNNETWNIPNPFKTFEEKYDFI